MRWLESVVRAVDKATRPVREAWRKRIIRQAARERLRKAAEEEEER